MSCPACGSELAAGQSRCAGCGALLAPPFEGALAPKPEPLRELPGVRKKEKSWRDEVNERVRSRKKRREAETGLPLFDGLQDAGESASGEEKASGEESRRPGPPSGAGEPPLSEVTTPAIPAPRIENTLLAGPAEEAFGDLPLRREEPEPRPDDMRVLPAPPPARDEEEFPLELQPPPPVSRPVERPAQFMERFQAGAVDFALLALVFGLVLYFASRAARVGLLGLLPAWPWLAGYLAFLGLVYAAYFTGTTGQTLGKMLVGLRVVDTGGQPPGYLRAFARAAVGALGLAAAGLGMVPVAFDPARRALHDRLFRTRVVSG